MFYHITDGSLLHLFFLNWILGQYFEKPGELGVVGIVIASPGIKGHCFENAFGKE